MPPPRPWSLFSLATVTVLLLCACAAPATAAGTNTDCDTDFGCEQRQSWALVLVLSILTLCVLLVYGVLASGRAQVPQSLCVIVLGIGIGAYLRHVQVSGERARFCNTSAVVAIARGKRAVAQKTTGHGGAKPGRL